MKKQVSEFEIGSDELLALMDDCAEALARENLERGVALMGQVIRLFPSEQLEDSPALILKDCAERLDEFGTQRINYFLLALHTASTALAQKQSNAFTRVFQ